MTVKIGQVGTAPPKPEPEEKPAQTIHTSPKPLTDKPSNITFPSQLKSVINMQQAIMDFKNNPIFQNPILNSLILANSSTKETDISQLLNQLLSVGTQTKNGYVPDGRWGSKTQAGLENLHNLLSGISHLPGAQTLHKTADALGELIQIYADPKKNSQSLSNAAQNIANLLHSATEEINQVFAQLKENSVIAQSGASIAFDYAKKLTDKAQYISQQFSNDFLPFTIPQDLTENAQPIQFKISDLTNPRNFSNFLLNNNITVGGLNPVSNQEAMQKLLSYIRDQINRLPEETTKQTILQETR